MLSFLYIIIAFAIGWQITELIILPQANARLNLFWVRLASSFGAGTLIVTWVVYLLAYMLHVAANIEKPLIPANAIVLSLSVILLAVLWFTGRKAQSSTGTSELPGRKVRKRAKTSSGKSVISGHLLHRLNNAGLVQDPKLFRKEAVFYLVVLAFVWFNFHYVLHMDGTELKMGFTVFSDYAPNIALIRSFSRFANFPTEYPFFAGQDIKYHFMFMFFTGNMEFLGLPLAFAYNLTSTLSLFGFFIMLSQLALRVTGRFSSAILTAVFFTFRSGLAVFLFIREHLKAGDLLEAFVNNTTFIGYTTNENWGLWNYNVYLNQRHLGFGLIIATTVIWYFYGYVEAACEKANVASTDHPLKDTLAEASLDGTSEDRKNTDFVADTSEDREDTDFAADTSEDREDTDFAADTSEDREDTDFVAGTSEDREDTDFAADTSEDREDTDFAADTSEDRIDTDFAASTSKKTNTDNTTMTAALGTWFHDFFLTKEAWLPQAPDLALVTGIIMGLCSFWNGACVIGGLLILAGFAIFSKHKLDFLILAVLSVLIAELQTKAFIVGSAVSPTICWGFISEDKSLLGVIAYLAEVAGLTILGSLFAFFIVDKKQKVLITAFMLPVIFSFTMSLTPDVTVNHKYIMMAMAYLSIIWSDIVVTMFSDKSGKPIGKGNIIGKVIACLIAFLLTATGLYDYSIIIRNNDTNHCYSVNTASELTAYVCENLTDDDLVLSDAHSVSELTVSGCRLYCGWPYYAWSAGYDTDTRYELAKQMYTSMPTDTIHEMLELEEITYVLYEENMSYDGVPANEEPFRELCDLVFTSSDGYYRLYKVR